MPDFENENEGVERDDGVRGDVEQLFSTASSSNKKKAANIAPIEMANELNEEIIDSLSNEDLIGAVPEEESWNINEELAEREAIRNEGLKQDIRLKRNTLFALFALLACETAVLFYLTYLQGVELNHFHMEEWSFKLLIGATITQITVMLQVAVKHLFPSK